MSFLGGTKVSQPSLDVDTSTVYIISISISPIIMLVFPGGSDSKEFTCSEEDLGSIPGLGRSPGEEKGYPLRYYSLGEFLGLCSSRGHRFGHD